MYYHNRQFWIRCLVGWFTASFCKKVTYRHRWTSTSSPSLPLVTLLPVSTVPYSACAASSRPSPTTCPSSCPIFSFFLEVSLIRNNLLQVSRGQLTTWLWFVQDRRYRFLDVHYWMLNLCCLDVIMDSWKGRDCETPWILQQFQSLH